MTRPETAGQIFGQTICFNQPGNRVTTCLGRFSFATVSIYLNSTGGLMLIIR